MATVSTARSTSSLMIKGYRGENAKEKKTTMDTYWVPGVNNLKNHGRWAFAEFTDVYAMQEDFAKKVEAEFDKIIQTVTEQAEKEFTL
jgi:type III restriction enzyme